MQSKLLQYEQMNIKMMMMDADMKLKVTVFVMFSAAFNKAIAHFIKLDLWKLIIK